MKQLQYIITTFSLIVALSGLSPVVAADAGRTYDSVRIQADQKSTENTQAMRLSAAQMDNVHAGANPIVVFIAARLIKRAIDKVRGRTGNAY